MAQDLVKQGEWGKVYDRSPLTAPCRQWTRDEYIARMTETRQYESDFRARAAAAAAEAAAQKSAAADAAQQQKAADVTAKAREQEALRYVADYTGTWGLPLDIRNDRRWGTKYMRLSDRQGEVLLEGKARDAARAEQALIAREIYAADEYAAHVARQQAPRPAQAPVQQRRGVTQDGMYKTADGTIYKVQQAVNGSGHLYAKVLDVDSRTFVYTPGAISRLTDADRMSLEDAQAFGRLYGFCVVCGRTLTDEQSIEAGIGPVCASKGFAA